MNYSKLWLVLVPAMCAEMVLAQPKRVDKGTEVKRGPQILRIRKLVGLGKRAKVRTPEFKTGATRSTKVVGEWARITVTYETAPARNAPRDEWIDELVFQYFALAAKKQPGKKIYTYSLFKNTVRYIDVERGRTRLTHFSTVFLHPNTLKRYGELVAVAVEISHKGEKLAAKYDTEKSRNIPSGEWWRNPAVVESKVVTVRDGYLLDRSQSPFALVNIDDYEVIK